MKSHTDPTPDLPAPMRLDAETNRLWEPLWAAKRDEIHLFQVAWEVRLRSGRFDAHHLDPGYPINAGLRGLLQRTADLNRDWNAYDKDQDLRIQEAAWRFVGHAFDLHHGDAIACAEGMTRRLRIEHFEIVDFTVGDLVVFGPILNKNGSPGQPGPLISLLRTPWCKLPGKGQ